MDFSWYYVLSAKGIQNFILQGDKLRLMVGGSELIENLPNVFLIDLLRELGLSENIDYKILSQAAGGARLLFKEGRAVRDLARVVPLALSRYVPGLDFVQDWRVVQGSLAATMDASEKALQQKRNLVFPHYPVAGPLIDRAPRSGLPVADRIHQGGTHEPADPSMLARDRASKRARHALLDKLLGEKFRSLRLPENIEDMFDGERGYVAVLHADANGLGAVVMALLEDLKKMDDDAAARAYSDFSRAVSGATEQSLRQAIQPMAEEAMADQAAYLPFRPLVCAGDDVTLVLKAEYAIPLAESFLTGFETASREALNALRIPGLEGKGLSAAAGIAFVHPNYPFSQAYALSESLCAFAKDASQRQGSSLAFWRVTNAMADDFSGILQRELKTREGLLTMMPYAVGEHPAQPRLDSLLQLAGAINALPRGSLRNLLTQMYHDKAATDQAYERIKEVAGNGAAKTSFHAFEQVLSSLTSNTAQPLWCVERERPCTPLHDAVELLAAVGRGKFARR